MVAESLILNVIENRSPPVGVVEILSLPTLRAWERKAHFSTAERFWRILVTAFEWRHVNVIAQ